MPERKTGCKLIAVTVGVVLVIGLVEVCVLVPLYKTHNVIKSDNYTEGDTDVNTFDPLYCKAVEMTKSEQSTASLHLLNAKPPLSWWDILKATLDDTQLQPENYFSDWIFHIHPGSEMTVSVCAVKLDPLCVPELRDEVWFRIIRGEENFTQWRGNQGNPNYAVKSFKLPISLSECPTPLTLQYRYEEEGDYYHVVKNSGNCAISIYANITINRTQYDNEEKSAGNCKIPNPQSSYKCSVPVKKTNSQYSNYTFLAMDQTSQVTEWKNNIRVTLTCIPRDWIIGVGSGIAVVGVLTIVTVWCCWCSCSILSRKCKNKRYGRFEEKDASPEPHSQDLPLQYPLPHNPYPSMQINATLEEIEPRLRGVSSPAQPVCGPEITLPLPFEKDDLESSGAHGEVATDDSEAGVVSGAQRLVRETHDRKRLLRSSRKNAPQADSAGASVTHKPQSEHGYTSEYKLLSTQ